MNKTSSLLLNLSLLAGSLLFTFLAAELATKLRKDRVPDRNFHLVLMDRDLLHSAYPTAYDAELGWIPRPGASGTNNSWGNTVTILDDSIRSNGAIAPPAQGQPVILAVGDFYTFGDEVSGKETWLARLEANTRRPVLNGGVFGYGLDQSFLRAMKLLKTHSADVLIVSIIPDDIGRCMLSMRTGVFKP